MDLNFLGTVKGALSSLGKAPYDDKHTEEVLSAATKRTLEYFDALCKAKEAKALIEHTSDFVAVTKAIDEEELSIDEFNEKYNCHLGK